MRKSKAQSLTVILQMTGHLLNHHHTSEVQMKHATPSVSTPTVDTTMERAFDVAVCQLVPSATLPPSLLQTFGVSTRNKTYFFPKFTKDKLCLQR